MTIITDEHMRAAEQDSEAAQTIIFAAECTMIAQGREDPFDVVTALLASAWFAHKELAPHRSDLFAARLWDFASIVDRSVVEH